MDWRGSTLPTATLCTTGAEALRTRNLETRLYQGNDRSGAMVGYPSSYFLGDRYAKKLSSGLSASIRKPTPVIIYLLLSGRRALADFLAERFHTRLGSLVHVLESRPTVCQLFAAFE